MKGRAQFNAPTIANNPQMRGSVGSRSPIKRMAIHIGGTASARRMKTKVIGG
jgi:hypothetical protein